MNKEIREKMKVIIKEYDKTEEIVCPPEYLDCVIEDFRILLKEERKFTCENIICDWKENPQQVIESLNNGLCVFGLEIVSLETFCDSYEFKIKHLK